MVEPMLVGWWYTAMKFYLLMSDRTKIICYSARSVLVNCEEPILRRLHQIGRVQGSEGEETDKLFAVLNKRYRDVIRVASWKFLPDEFQVVVSWSNGAVEERDLGFICFSEDLGFLRELAALPLINEDEDPFGIYLEKLVKAQVEFWYHAPNLTEEDEDEDDEGEDLLSIKYEEETDFMVSPCNSP